MLDKNQLSKEELEKVTGGCNGTTDPGYSGFSGYVDMYGLSVGSEYYFTKESGGYVCWYRAKVLETWEDHQIFNYTARRHKIEIKERGQSSGWSVGETATILGDDYAAYQYKN